MSQTGVSVENVVNDNGVEVVRMIISTPESGAIFSMDVEICVAVEIGQMFAQALGVLRPPR